MAPREEKIAQEPDERTRPAEEREALARDAADLYEAGGSEESAEDELALGRSSRLHPEEPDVLLDVSNLHVDEITLNVQDLHAHVALHAAVGNLVALDVGADVDIERVELELRGVDAQALLKVHLDRVYDILARTLTTVDRNPTLLDNLLRPAGELVSSLGRTVEETVPEVGRTLGHTVEETVPEVGRTVGRTVEETAPEVGRTVGRTVEETAPGVGRTVGRTIEETAPEVGRTVEEMPAAANAVKPTAQAVPAMRGERGARTEVEETVPAAVERRAETARVAAETAPERAALEWAEEDGASPESKRGRVVQKVRDAARNARTAVARTMLRRRRARPLGLAKVLKRKRDRRSERDEHHP